MGNCGKGIPKGAWSSRSEIQVARRNMVGEPDAVVSLIERVTFGMHGACHDPQYYRLAMPSDHENGGVGIWREVYVAPPSGLEAVVQPVGFTPNPAQFWVEINSAREAGPPLRSVRRS